MNNDLLAYARKTLKDGLAQCTEGQQAKFKQMYSFQDRSADIEDVVDNMPDEKLDRAMEQVEGTLAKNVGSESNT